LYGEGEIMLEIINDNFNLGKWSFFVKAKVLAIRTDKLK